MSKKDEHRTHSEHHRSKHGRIPEEEKVQLRKKTNKSISRYCGYAALVVVLVTFAAFILGVGNDFHSQCGIMVSIALLAIALINDPDRS